MRHYAPGKSVRLFALGLTETLSCFKNGLDGDRTHADVWRRCQFAGRPGTDVRLMRVVRSYGPLGAGLFRHLVAHFNRQWPVLPSVTYRA
jgi:hypothetical protein